jgi:hypothetical protein
MVMVAATALSGCAIGFRGTPIEIGDQYAILRGEVLSDRTEPGEYWFRYGTTPAYGQDAIHQPYNFQAGVRSTVVETVTGLDHHTTYHYALCAQDQDPNFDEFCSGDSTFTTTGDHIRGPLLVLFDDEIVTVTFNDVRSGAHGEEPLGSVTGSEGLDPSPVTCMRVFDQRAVVGVESEPGASYTFIYIDLSGSPGTAASEPAGSTPPTNCPSVIPNPGTTLYFAGPGAGFEIHDE